MVAQLFSKCCCKFANCHFVAREQTRQSNTRSNRRDGNGNSEGNGNGDGSPTTFSAIGHKANGKRLTTLRVKRGRVLNLTVTTVSLSGSFLFCPFFSVLSSLSFLHVSFFSVLFSVALRSDMMGLYSFPFSVQLIPFGPSLPPSITYTYTFSVCLSLFFNHTLFAACFFRF